MPLFVYSRVRAASVKNTAPKLERTAAARTHAADDNGSCKANPSRPSTEHRVTWRKSRFRSFHSGGLRAPAVEPLLGSKLSLIPRFSSFCYFWKVGGADDRRRSVGRYFFEIRGGFLQKDKTKLKTVYLFTLSESIFSVIVVVGLNFELMTL